MSKKVRAICGLCALLAAVLTVGIASAAEKEEAHDRRFDVGIGGGAYITIGSNNDAPLKDGWYVLGSGAIELSDRFDAELGVGVGQDRDTKSNNVRTFVQGYGGFRWYALGANPTDAARLYLAAGGAVLENYARSGDVKGAVYVGPGVRVLAGDRSGLDVRLPFVITPYDTSETLVIPTVSFFYQF